MKEQSTRRNKITRYQRKNDNAKEKWEKKTRIKKQKRVRNKNKSQRINEKAEEE